MPDREDKPISPQRRQDAGIRRHVGDEFQRREATYRLVVEATDDCIAMLDGQGRLIFANNRPASLMSCSPPSCIGRSILAVIHPEDRERTVEHIRKWFKNDRTRVAQEEDSPFDAVIVDLTVPAKMGGMETFGRLRKPLWSAS